MTPRTAAALKLVAACVLCVAVIVGVTLLVRYFVE
jgi:hypothetical protein